MIHVIMVYRPDSADEWGKHEHDSHPFNGVEVLAVFNSEEKALAAMDMVAKEHRDWKFLVTPIPGAYIRFEDGEDGDEDDN